MLPDDPVQKMMQAMHVSVPDDLRCRMESAFLPHLEQVQTMLQECRDFASYYQHLIRTGELHPESALELLKWADLLRFQLIDSASLMDSLVVVAEYAAFQEADGKTVELKRKQCEVWVLPLERVSRILKEYSDWLANISFTLRGIYRRGDV